MNEKTIYRLSLVLLILGMLLNLGLQPLYLEEPRRTLIAMEMYYSGNWWVPTQLGAYYYNKPPVYNWLLIISAWIHGGFSEWAVRLPTVLSTFVIGLLLFLQVNKYVNTEAAWLSTLLFLVSGGMLFYFTTLAEIDLFYALITLGSMLAVFHFQQQNRYYPLYLFAYGLGAIGFLTKGLPSIAFTGLTLVSWLIYTKDWKKLFSIAHLLGILLFVLLSAGYYYIYSRFNDPTPFLTTLLDESSDRTMAKKTFWQLFAHIITLPLHIIKDLLPGAIFMVYLMRSDLLSKLLKNNLVTFALLTVLVNVSVYWFSPGTRLRYIYALYPLILLVLVYAWQARHDLAHPWRAWTVQGFTLLITFALPLGALALPFMENFDFLAYRWPLAIVFFLSFGALAYFRVRYPGLQIPLLILSLAVARLFFDLTILPQRNHDTEAQAQRDKAKRIHQMVPEDAPLYLLNDSRVSFTLIAYLNRYRKAPVLQNFNKIPEAYYILPADETRPSDRILYKLNYHGQTYVLTAPEIKRNRGM